MARETPLKIKPCETDIHPLQVEAWRRMGASGRSQLAMDLRRQARRWKADALRQQHADWTEERVQRELALITLRGNT